MTGNIGAITPFSGQAHFISRHFVMRTFKSVIVDRVRHSRRFGWSFVNTKSIWRWIETSAVVLKFDRSTEKKHNTTSNNFSRWWRCWKPSFKNIKIGDNFNRKELYFYVVQNKNLLPFLRFVTLTKSEMHSSNKLKASIIDHFGCRCAF